MRKLLTVKKVVFFTNQRVLEVHPLRWLVDRFFLETIGIEYKSEVILAAANRAALSNPNIERKLSRVRNTVFYLLHTRHSSTYRCCSATFNLLGITHLVAGDSSRGL
jgi:hypothetical protein